tara:strand:- start:340 stop:624 length:285 start_codon:yes stop_codon:yes gene_type:complete
MTNNLSKKRRLINYMYSGGGANKGVTANEAKSKFGVANIRATMSDIKEMVERYGNWEIVSEETSTGKTRYFMVDTHPGSRTFAFDTDGSRYMVA